MKRKKTIRKLNASRLSVPERHQLKIARATLKMSDAMVPVMGGMTKEQAREVFRRLMAKARGEKNPRRRGRRKAKKNAAPYGKAQKSHCEMCGRKSGLKQAPDPSGKSRTLCTLCRVGSQRILKAGGPAAWRKKQNRRRINYGEGNLFNFHGAFVEKADAIAKEKKTPGSFIRTVWFKDGPRYGVLTRKNPKRNSVAWGRNTKQNRRPRGKRKNTMAWGKIDPKRDTQAFHQALKRLFPGKEVKDLSKVELSKLATLAYQLLKGTKNPVRKVAGGWRAIGPRGRMGPVLPTQRDAEIYAESLRINPRQSKRAKMKSRRRNYADATELYTKFHGKGPARVTDTGLPIADYDNHPELGQLGRVVSLIIGDEEAEKPWKKKIEWKGAEAPDLAAEPGGRQLYIIGGGQDLDALLDTLPVETERENVDLGFGYRIEYFSQKKFDNFQPVTYYHDLGEETGERPRVVYDRVKKRIHLVGGAYEVKPEGIVN